MIKDLFNKNLEKTNKQEIHPITHFNNTLFHFDAVKLPKAHANF